LYSCHSVSKQIKIIDKGKREATLFSWFMIFSELNRFIITDHPLNRIHLFLMRLPIMDTISKLYYSKFLMC
ncbi:hypothetical protein CVR98_26945, partial [Salmonella enterica subsp. enterica serovar Enteritidis]